MLIVCKLKKISFEDSWHYSKNGWFISYCIDVALYSMGTPAIGWDIQEFVLESLFTRLLPLLFLSNVSVFEGEHELKELRFIKFLE
jgi:hypothetical protein